MSTANGHHTDVANGRHLQRANSADQRSYDYPGESYNIRRFHSLSANDPKHVLFRAFNDAGKNSHFKICQLMKTYSKHCSISSLRDEHGQTLLHIACARMSLGTVKILVEDYGLDPTVVDNNGVTPAMIAQRQRKLSIIEYFNDCPKQKRKSNGSGSILKTTKKPTRAPSKLKFTDTQNIILTYDESDIPRNIMSPRPTLSKEECFDEGRDKKARGVSFRTSEDIKARDHDIERQAGAFTYLESIPSSDAVDGDFELPTYRDMRQQQLSIEKEEERSEAMASCIDKITRAFKFSKVVFIVLVLLIGILIAIAILIGIVYLLSTESESY